MRIKIIIIIIIRTCSKSYTKQCQAYFDIFREITKKIINGKRIILEKKTIEVSLFVKQMRAIK